MWEDAKEKRNLYVPIQVHWTEVPGRDAKWKKDTIANIGMDRWNQEFECQFLGGQNTLISSSKLKTMVMKAPIETLNCLDIYEEPTEDRVYTMTVDVSHGEGNDYSAFSVIDSSKFPYRQVAKYRNSNISPLLFPSVISNVAKKYNEAWVLIEREYDLNHIPRSCWSGV
jgi:hypothetical protein